MEAGTTIDSLLVAAVDREGNFIKSDKARALSCRGCFWGVVFVSGAIRRVCLYGLILLFF